MAELLGRLIPIASIAEAIVLAVYIPPQEPAPGIDLDSISSNCSSLMLLEARCPTASKIVTISAFLLFTRPGMMVPP